MGFTGRRSRAAALPALTAALQPLLSLSIAALQSLYGLFTASIQPLNSRGLSTGLQALFFSTELQLDEK